MSESDVTLPMLDEDPWIRFDTWAARSWELLAQATEIAISNGPSVISDDGPDGRVLALFHAAEVAKEFAFAVNPRTSGSPRRSSGSADVQVLTPEMLVELLSDDDDD